MGLQDGFETPSDSTGLIAPRTSDDITAFPAHYDSSANHLFAFELKK